MKKFLLTLVCLFACLPFVNARVIVVNTQDRFNNNIFQVQEENGDYQPALKIFFLDSSKGEYYDLTGIIDPKGATVIAPDKSEIRSVAMSLGKGKINSWSTIETTFLRIDFPYFPETSKEYRLI